VHELRGADSPRTLCGGDEQRIGAGGDIRFTGAERGGAGDDLCVVSGEGGVVEAGDGAVFDFVFAPAAASREEEKTYSCPINIPVAESWWQAIVSVVRSYAKSFWYVFRVAFPLMILGAVLGAVVIELLPPQAIIAQASIGGIVLVALVGAFLPVPMAFDVAIAYIAMTHGAPMP
jgi:uncharacterized membrane protein YraQ (UPF0718 family)